jgi:hypothetical protein
MYQQNETGSGQPERGYHSVLFLSQDVVYHAVGMNVNRRLSAFAVV